MFHRGAAQRQVVWKAQMTGQVVTQGFPVEPRPATYPYLANRLRQLLGRDSDVPLG